MELSKFDAADYINSDEDAAFFLEACIDEAIDAGDHRIVTSGLETIARARGMAATAEAAGITRAGLYKALGENGDPRLSTVVAVMKALGIRMAREAA